MDSEKKLLTAKQAANYLGFEDSTLRNSRHTGRLAGVFAPAYRKIGSAVRYERATLDAWLGQFKEQTCSHSAA